MPYQPHQLAEMARQVRSGTPLSGLAAPAPKARKPRSNPEWQLQHQLFKWWKSYCRGACIESCLFFAVPNGASLSGGNERWQKNERGRKGAMLKMTGLTAGVADCLLCVPVFRHGYAEGTRHVAPKFDHGLFVELKAPQGIISDDQRVFTAAVVAQGYKHVIVRSLAEGINEITTYLTK